MVLAGISHDLRTPLSRLRLALEMSGAEPAAAQGMNADVEEMAQVIGQFLDFARGEDEAKMPGDLDALVHETVAGYARRGTRIEFRAGSPPRFAFAPLAVRRALANLIDNALRYGAEPIELETRREGAFALAEVRDRGPGVPQSEVERLKRPFTRLDEARSGPAGAGLGLAIAERVARSHGGRLELLARAGGGLIARLWLRA
jgi:two-component system osmolarity sensor histidine kinase EnvZ